MKKLLLAAMAAAILPALSGPSYANNVVKWRTIVGQEDASAVKNGAVANNAVFGIGSGGQAWTTLGGQARINLDSGALEFEVSGLVLNGGNAIGTPDGITQVAGRIACGPNAADQVQTDSVPLSPQGDASFEGTIIVPTTCTKSNIVFLVVIPRTPPVWIANGAVRE
jgi:hypothetical protein